MDPDKPPIPRKELDKRLKEIRSGEYTTLRELETRILKKIAIKKY